MIEELEEEILEMRAIAVRVGGGELKTLESEKMHLAKELESMKVKLEDSTSKLNYYWKKRSNCQFSISSQNPQKTQHRQSPKTLR